MDRFELLKNALSAACPALELRTEEPMSRHTSFRIGGPAALMALPKTKGEAAAAVKTARELGITPFFLGNGSNLLVPDEGYEGFVVKLSGELNQVREVNGQLEAGLVLTHIYGDTNGEGRLHEMNIQCYYATRAVKM